MAKDIHQYDLRLTERTSDYRSENNMKKRWVALLHDTIEGRALKNSVLVANQHQWVANATRLLMGCDTQGVDGVSTRATTTRGRALHYIILIPYSHL